MVSFNEAADLLTWQDGPTDAGAHDNTEILLQMETCMMLQLQHRAPEMMPLYL